MPTQAVSLPFKFLFFWFYIPWSALECIQGGELVDIILRMNIFILIFS